MNEHKTLFDVADGGPGAVTVMNRRDVDGWSPAEQTCLKHRVKGCWRCVVAYWLVRDNTEPMPKRERAYDA